VPKPEKTSAQFAMEIHAVHKQSIEAMLQIGHTLMRAKQALPHGKFTKMITSDLPFDASTAQRYMKIASDPRLATQGARTNQPKTTPDIEPTIVKQPLILMFLDDKDDVTCQLIPPPGYGYDAFGLLICDLIRHVARLFKVDEKDVFKWIEIERRKPTTKISGEIIGSLKGGSK
jgi:hypothetical protein